MVLTEIYKAIADKLAPINDWLHVDLFNNQFENEERENAVTLPCVLVGFGNIVWQNVGMGGVKTEQQGDLQVMLHIACELYENSGWDSPENERDSALEFDVFVSEITNAIQQLSSESFTPLYRVETRYSANYDNRIITEVVFETTVMEVLEKANLETLATLRIFKNNYPHPIV